MMQVLNVIKTVLNSIHYVFAYFGMFDQQTLYNVDSERDIFVLENQ